MKKVFVIALSVVLWGPGPPHGARADTDAREVVEGGGRCVAPTLGRCHSDWRIRDLGTLGGLSSDALAINNRGHVVGSAETADDERHAYLWRDGVMIDLGTLGGENSGAEAINNQGQVVGVSLDEQGKQRAFIWEEGAMTDLGYLDSPSCPPIGGCSRPFDINDKGQVVGRSFVEEVDAHHAFLWERGVMTDLGTLGGTYSEAVAINERGQVIGTASTESGELHGFLWEKGHMMDLGTLGGSESVAVALDERGRVVGHADTPYGTHGFLWEKGSMIDLEDLGGDFTQSLAVALNDRRQVVGWSTPVGRNGRGFVWQRGIMNDVGTLGGQYSAMYAINNAGLAVGWADTIVDLENPDNPYEWHAFLWEHGKTIDLGTLGGSSSYAMAINERGQIVGGSSLAGDLSSHATLWSRSNPRDRGRHF